MKHNEIRAVRMAANVLKSAFPVKEVILFGSKARGDDDPESDIDLLVLTTCEATHHLRKKIIRALFDIEQRCDADLSPLIVAAEDWEKGPLSVLAIHDAVREDGIAL